MSFVDVHALRGRAGSRCTRTCRFRVPRRCVRAGPL